MLHKNRGAGLVSVSALREVASRFMKGDGGGASVIAAVALPVVIGAAALSLEFGTGLLFRVENQNLADISAHAAALSYARTSGDAPLKQAVARGVAANIAALNGVNPDRLELTFSQDASGRDLVRAEIDATHRLMLARVLSNNSELAVVVSALARIGNASPGYACVLGLNGGEIDDATIIGGNVSVNLSYCSLASNNEFRINGNPDINAHCTSPGNDLTEGKCRDGWNRGGPFEDPYHDRLNWSTDCSSSGKALEAGQLEPGLHCITSVNLKGQDRVEGTGVTLFFAPGIDFDMQGGQTLAISPPSDGELKGVLIYAPGSRIDLAGTSDLIGLDCFGVVAQYIILRGTNRFEGECEEARNLGLDGRPTGADVRLVR